MILANREKVPFRRKTTFIYTPIPEISRTDADVVLVFMAIGGVNHYEPVHDPLFSANRAWFNPDMNMTLYRPDSPSGTMACAVQVSSPERVKNMRLNYTAVSGVHRSPWHERLVYPLGPFEQQCVAR
jgi:hypothetical protein